MIPKVIHFCWFGGKPYSPLVEECMATWKEKLPEYQIKRWDESNSPIEKCRFAKQSYKRKKWAFVADYVRFYALYNEGGIYLDTDMFVLKSFDSFLHHDCFLGMEDPGHANCAIIGAVRNHAFMREMLNHYESFNSQWLMPKYSKMIVPRIASRILHAKGMKPENLLQEVFGVHVYPTDYFYSYPFESHYVPKDFMSWVTPNSYAVHRWNLSWLSKTRFLKTGRYEEVFPMVWEEFRENPFQQPKFYGRVVEHGIKYLFQKMFRSSKTRTQPLFEKESQMTETSEKQLTERINFYVINLDRAVDRMERIEKDFASFPIPFIRVPAIEGKTLTIPIEDYDAPMFYLYVGREAGPGEVGCYLSHLKVLRMFLESDKEFALICEDDASPTPECYEVIEQAIAHSDTWDLLRLYIHAHRHSIAAMPYRSLTSIYNLCTPITGMRTAAAYIVNRRAAEILFRELVPMTSQYDNALFQGRVGVREATVLPNCMFLNEHNNISTIAGDYRRYLKPWHLVFWTCRLRRLWVRIVRYSLQIYRLIRRRLGR